MSSSAPGRLSFEVVVVEEVVVVVVVVVVAVVVVVVVVVVAVQTRLAPLLHLFQRSIHRPCHKPVLLGIMNSLEVSQYYIPGPSKRSQMVPEGCQFTIPLILIVG